MDIGALASRVRGLVDKYGEVLTASRVVAGPATWTLLYKCCVEVTPKASISQLAGLVLTTSGQQPAEVSTVSPTPETYPTLGLVFDPMAPAATGSGGPSPVYPAVGDTFVRDGVTLTLQELYTVQPANIPVALIGIAVHV